MRNRGSTPRRTRSGPLQDLLLILLAAVALVWVFSATEITEPVYALLQRTLPGKEDDLLMGLALAALGFGAFAFARWRQAHSEVAARGAAEAKYRTLLEQLPVVVYIDAIDDVSTALYISPQYERLLGYSAEERMTDPELWIRQLHSEDRERVIAESIRTNETGDPFVVEYRMISKDGREVWVRDEAAIVRNSEGSPLFWQGVLLDITERKRAEFRQAETEMRYRTLVESIPAVTYIQGTEPGAPVTYISPQIERLLGYTPEEWGPSFELWRDSIHPDDRERVLAADRRSDDTGQPFDVEYRMRHRDGRWIWVHDEAVLVRDGEGLPLFWQGVRFDISARKQAEEQLREAEQRFRTLVEHTPAVLYIDPADEHRPSIYVSPQIEEVLGVPRDVYLSDVEMWLDLVHPDDRALVLDAYRESLRTNRGMRIEYRVVRPDDGRIVWIRDESVFLVGEGDDPTIVQGVMFDVTERKLAEQALQESERREREAAERLRAVDEMKNTFLAAVSHELRSPLTSILGTAITLERQDVAASDRADLLARLAQNARKLDRLLSDLLDIDRLNRGILTPQCRPTDLGALVRRTVESLDILGERSITVEAEPVILSLDGAKVERIVENLLANAVRHTSPDRHIWVRVCRDGAGALLAVEDDGPGVPEQLQDVIFEPFRQGPTASPHSPGTGIGLSLVAMFAELHGGRAWVRDRAGGGSSFRVFLPETPPSTTPTDGFDDAAGGHDAASLDPAGAG